MTVDCRKVNTIAEFVDGIRLRVRTFIIEQKCAPGWEPDEEDRDAEHFVAVNGNTTHGVLRVRTEAGRVFKIERMAIESSSRKCGVGRELISFVVADLCRRDPSRIWLQAQVQARGFYEKCNFRAVSTEYDLYGISHLDMEYVLPGCLIG